MREIFYLDAINEALSQAMTEDERVFLIGEDIGVYGGAFGVTLGLLEKFGPERVIDTPISEPAIIGIGAGSATTGQRPVVEIMFSDFLLLTMDQLANQAAKMRYMFGGKAKVPMVIRAPGGGGTGAAAQHSQSIEAMLLHFPGLKIAMPSNPYDVKGLLISAIKDENPVIVIEHKLLYKKVKGPVPEEMYEIGFGKANIIKQGRDVTVVATSYMVQKLLGIVDKIQSEGIDMEIIDPRTIKPLDIDTIVASVKKTGRAVLIEEACYTGGFTSFLASEISLRAFDWLDAPVQRITGLDAPIPYSVVLENEVIPSEERIINGIKKALL